jgi:predicted dehydrogenase
MLNIGIVGFGFMGRMHYRCWKGRDDAKIVAICDVNENVVEDSQKAVGNVAGAEEAIDFSGINIYSDLGKMLDQEKLDVVSITLPTFLHADSTVQALAAGVNVLCEKPMSLHMPECERMIAAAKDSGKILQIGHCLRFWPEWAVARQIVADGKYGKLLAASFRRLSAPPTWSHENWLMNQQRSGGVELDLHIHDSDYVQYLLGMPRAVCSFGAEGAGGGLAHIVTQYLYDDNMVITAEGGWAMAPSFGFEMSFNIMLEKATIVYDCTRDPAFKVCPVEGDAFTPEIPSGDGYIRQIDHLVRLINGETLPPVTTLEQSLNSIKIVEAEKESIRTGGIVSIK